MRRDCLSYHIERRCIINPIRTAIQKLRYAIPRRLLELAFVERYTQWRAAPTNIDEAIENQVIRPRVLLDCDLHGGTEDWVWLEGLPYERVDEYTSVYKIPKERTQNRTIIAVLDLTFTDPTRASSFGITAGCQNSTLMQAGQAVMDAHGMLPITSTAYVQLIGENTVQVRDSTMLPPQIYLRCVLSNDKNLQHLQVRSFPQFSRACELAVKAYIYNRLVIDVDVGEIQSGQVIGKIKEILDSYADANEQYDEYFRNVMGQVLFQNDNESMRRFLKSLVGGYR